MSSSIKLSTKGKMSPKLHEMNSHKLSQSSNFRKESVLHKTTFFFISASYFTCALKSPQTAVAIVPLYVLSSSPFASSTPTEMNFLPPRRKIEHLPHTNVFNNMSWGVLERGFSLFLFGEKLFRQGKERKYGKSRKIVL